MVDAITTQVVRNRIGSLMQEMHYHFYRSGYSTIIRESRDSPALSSIAVAD